LNIDATDINFDQAERSFYLTQTQIQAIEAIDRRKNFRSRQIIVGPWGTGKTLLMKVKLFIQAQTDRNIPLFISRNLIAFAELNAAKFRRSVNCLDSSTSGMAVNGDLIIDDGDKSIYPLLNSLKEEQNVSLVMWDYTVFMPKNRFAPNPAPHGNYYIMELKTTFRSTMQLEKFQPSGELLASPDGRRPRIRYSGHSFDGIRVEQLPYGDQTELVQLLIERIQRLIQVDHCQPGDIGIYMKNKPGSLTLSYKIPVFTEKTQLLSVEFPVLITIDLAENETSIVTSRANCHLIQYNRRPVEKCDTRL